MAKTVQAHGIQLFAKVQKLDNIQGTEHGVKATYPFLVALAETMANGYVWLTPEGKKAVTDLEQMLDAALVQATGTSELDTKVVLPEEPEHASEEAIEAAIAAGEELAEQESAKGMSDDELEEQAAKEKRRRAAKKAAATRRANRIAASAPTA